jgi:mono/diheme cytochrome c family protein
VKRASLATACLMISMCWLGLLSGCRKTAADPALSPKARGTQIVEVSGGKQVSGVGAKLTDPVIVQVNGADGNAVTGALVAFRSEGLTFNPAEALTDSSGQVSVVVQLGGIPGSYQVVAETPKPDGSMASVSLREIALGYQEKVGKEVSEKYCSSCHDPESTPERVSNFDNLAPPPPHQFTDGNTLNAMSDADLVKIIADGGPALGKSPQTPAYRSTLSAAQIKAVVAYIRAVADPPYQPGEAKKK